MSLLERLAPSASTVARTVGTGLLTFPLGLTEVMVMVPPEPVPPAPFLLLVPAPVRLVALLTVRSTTFLGFGTHFSPSSQLVLPLQLLFRCEAWPKPPPERGLVTLKRPGRAPLPLYSRSA
jgi:hypothetical protein